MQSVLFTVFRTDSAEKINIWVATREISLWVGKNQHTQLQRLARILKISCCDLCCSCLCSLSLPRGAVGWSGVCDRGIFWSLSNYYILQLTRINFARGWGQGPIFLFSRGFQLFSNCYFIKKRVYFPGWVVRTSSPLWTCAQPIYMCLCIKPLKCSRQYFFSKDIGFHSRLKLLCRQNHYFFAFVLGSTSRNH